MADSKKPMTENEKKAKLSVLKDANKQASDAIKGKMQKFKDSKQLKSHVKDMSDEAMYDFKNDSDSIVDPGHDGDVVGRHISDENMDHAGDQSVYDLEEIDARIKSLMEQKAKVMKGK